jgi:hypothetical protein
VIDFESAVDGSDAATLGAAGVSIAGGLVMSETLVQTTTGYPAMGAWNTTPGGSQGVLNTLGASLVLDFDAALTALTVDVLALPDAAGDAGVILLLAFAGPLLVASDASDPLAIGDSGLPEDTLAIAADALDGVRRVVLCAAAASGGCADPGLPTTLWADEIRFEVVPEPATVALLGLCVAALAAGRRSR